MEFPLKEAQSCRTPGAPPDTGPAGEGAVAWGTVTGSLPIVGLGLLLPWSGRSAEDSLGFAHGPRPGENREAQGSWQSWWTSPRKPSATSCLPGVNFLEEARHRHREVIAKMCVKNNWKNFAQILLRVRASHMIFIFLDSLVFSQLSAEVSIVTVRRTP